MNSDRPELHVNPRPLPDWSTYAMHLTRYQVDEVLHYGHIIPISKGYDTRFFAQHYPGWSLNEFFAIFRAAEVRLNDIGHNGRCHWQLKHLHFDSTDAFAVEWDESVAGDDGRRATSERI